MLSFFCISAYAHIYFKTTIIKQNIKIIIIAGVPSSQALPGYLITAPPSVCVPDVIGVLAVWISNQKNKKVPSSQALPYYCTSICVRSCSTWRASCMDPKTKQNKKWDWTELNTSAHSKVIVRFTSLTTHPYQHIYTFKNSPKKRQNTKTRKHTTWKMIIIIKTNTIPKFTTIILICHFKTSFHIPNTLPMYEYIASKRNWCPRSIAGVPFDVVGILAFCGLPCYCAPLACIPGVLDVLRHNKPKTKNHSRLFHSLQTHNSRHHPVHHPFQLLALSTPHSPNHRRKTRPEIPYLHRPQHDLNFLSDPLPSLNW